jgi:hypothetical protein
MMGYYVLERSILILRLELIYLWIFLSYMRCELLLSLELGGVFDCVVFLDYDYI